jgi:hypothetical protein
MIPAGITTATVHLDAPVSFTGEPGRLHVVIAPSVSLIWTATGTPLGSFTDTFSLNPGKELSVELPHTDQPGFEDGFGNDFTGWYYTATVVYEKDGRRINFPPRDFQILAGQTEVDLALVPAGEAAPVPEIAPILPVTSIDGFTGAVTKTILGLQNVDNTTDAQKPVSTLQQAALDKKIDAVRDAGDTFQILNRRLDFKDLVTAKGSMINLDHRSDGTGNTASPGQTYGIDLHNYPGAKAGFVFHQYSSVERAFALDNTGSAPMIEINNTENQTLNPGSTGTGDFFLLREMGTSILRLDKDVVFRVGSTKVATFLNTGNKALSVQAASTYNGEAMDVTKAGTGAGTALKVNNSGTGIGLHINQLGAGQAFKVSANLAANAGVYPSLVEGWDYGPSFTTAANGGTVLHLVKNASGSGAVLSLLNKGTGQTAAFKDTSGAILSQIAANGEFQHDVAGAGVVLKAPAGQKYRITVADDGVLTTTAIA